MNLPREILVYIFSQVYEERKCELYYHRLSTYRLVCNHWNEIIINSPCLWKYVYFNIREESYVQDIIIHNSKNYRYLQFIGNHYHPMFCKSILEKKCSNRIVFMGLNWFSCIPTIFDKMIYDNLSYIEYGSSSLSETPILILFSGRAIHKYIHTVNKIRIRINNKCYDEIVMASKYVSEYVCYGRVISLSIQNDRYNNMGHIIEKCSQYLECLEVYPNHNNHENFYTSINY